MDLKSVLKKEAEKAILKKATNKILPMAGDAPKFGKKSKIAAVLITFAGIATALAEYL
jgi:hypothetical protein